MTRQSIGIVEAISRVVSRFDLTQEEAASAMSDIMSGASSPAQTAAFITALRVKGDSVEEITGFAMALREHVRTVDVGALQDRVVDTCGTGGDGSGTFNISTAAAIVATGAGAEVAKHGNRSITSNCGSADVLEALGVAIELEPDQVAQSLQRTGMGFMFAPLFHPGFRHAGPARKEIGIRTVFNILGPLTNPAGARRQIVGVGDPDTAQMLAEALGRLGSTRVLLVTGEGGVDELTLSGVSRVTEYDSDLGGTRSYEVRAADLGLIDAPVTELQGGSIDENAEIVRNILDGETGPPRDVVVLNTAATLYAAGKVEQIEDGIEIAQQAIDSGAARDALDTFASVTQALSRNS